MKFKLVEAAESKICCICKKPFDGYGNNAEPVCSGSCCDECNMKEVIPARMRMLDKASSEDIDEAVLNESSERFVLIGFNHFDPENLIVIHGSKSDLESIDDDRIDYSEIIPATDKLLWIENNDEYLQVSTTDFNSIDEFRDAVVTEMQKNIDAGNHEFEILGLTSFYIDEDSEGLSAQELTDKFMTWIDESFVDGDSNSAIQLIKGDELDDHFISYTSVEEFMTRDDLDDEAIDESLNESYYQLSKDDFTVHYLGEDENLWNDLIDNDDELDNYLVDWFTKPGYYHVTGGGDSYIDNEWVDSLQEFNELCFGDEYYVEKLNEAIDASKALEVKKNSDADVIFYGWQYKNEDPVEIDPEELTYEEYQARKDRIVADYNKLYADKPQANRYAKEHDFIFYALHNRKNEELNEGRFNPYFTPYGYRAAAKVLSGTAPEYYWHLKEIEMDRGDGIRLANYALKKGLPVMLDKHSDPDYPEFYLKDGLNEYHWGDYFYTYGFTNPDATQLVPYEGNLDILNTEKDDSKMDENMSIRAKLKALYPELDFGDKVKEAINEGNSVSGKIPPALDSFLQDIAQMYGTIDYGDIMDHDYTADDIRKLNNLRRRFITWAQYDEDDEEVKAKFNEIANKVAEILKSDNIEEAINESVDPDMFAELQEYTEDADDMYISYDSEYADYINELYMEAVEKLEKEFTNLFIEPSIQGTAGEVFANYTADDGAYEVSWEFEDELEFLDGIILSATSEEDYINQVADFIRENLKNASLVENLDSFDDDMNFDIEEDDSIRRMNSLYEGSDDFDEYDDEDVDEFSDCEDDECIDEEDIEYDDEDPEWWNDTLDDETGDFIYQAAEQLGLEDFWFEDNGYEGAHTPTDFGYTKDGINYTAECDYEDTDVHSIEEAVDLLKGLDWKEA